MKTSTRVICILIIALGALNFGAFALHNQQLGGDALNGQQANGKFYVSDHGRETEVSRQQWQLIRWQALSIFITHPLALGAGFFLLTRHEFPKKMFRGDAEERARTVAQIRESGPLTTQFGCAGKVGAINFSAGLIKVEVYPDGLVAKLRFIGEFGVRASEIESVEKRTSLLITAIEIVHYGPNVVSPIKLRCADNEAATQALLSLARRNIN